MAGFEDLLSKNTFPFQKLFQPSLPINEKLLALGHWTNYWKQSHAMI